MFGRWSNLLLFLIWYVDLVGPGEVGCIVKMDGKLPKVN